MTWLAGAFGGLLFVLSIPKADVGALAWVCLVPGLLLVPAADRRGLLRIGLSWGIVAGAGRAYWVSDTLTLYGAVPPVLSAVTTILLVGYLSLYPALFFLCLSRADLSSVWLPWVAAAGWVVLEWVQGWAFTGFPWEYLGTSQYLNRPVLQLASVAGVYGLSFLVVLVNAAVAQAIHLHARCQRWAWQALPPAMALAGAIAFGYARLHADEQSPPGVPLEVAIVQGSIPQDQKWERSRLEDSTGRYVELARTLVGTPLDLVVFPETALPFTFDDPRHGPIRQAVVDLARDLDAPILLGSLGGAPVGSGGQVFNRALLVDRSGAVAGHYDKVHLVPFGEYLPMRWLFGYLGGLTAQSGAFSPGRSFEPVDLPGAGTSLGVFICYESTFPEIPRTLTQRGAQVLVTVTNDAWFGRSAAPYQHFSMAVVRAVETGRPVVRAANTGISGFISPTGGIVASTGLFEPAVVTGTVAPGRDATFYVRHGHLVPLLCAALLIGASARGRAPRAHR